VGGKKKLKRFADNKIFTNVIEPFRYDVLDGCFLFKGKWRLDFFKNNNPIVLELGCGKGEYTLALAQRFPNKNFIGIDLKGARLWSGAKAALEGQHKNVVFVRTQIELIEYIFAEDEVNEIWITFPDPQIKYKRTKHRLTNTNFLQRYKKILNEEGIVHLKTDSEFMHGYTLGLLHGEKHEILYANHNIYTNKGAPDIVTSVQTFYEKQYLATDKAITYIQFKIR